MLANARAMRLAAREERWDDLTAHEGTRVQCLQGLVESDLQMLPPHLLATKAELIHDILACDAETYALAQSRQTDLAEMLGSYDNERKLAKTYHGG